MYPAHFLNDEDKGLPLTSKIIDVPKPPYPKNADLEPPSTNTPPLTTPMEIAANARIDNTSRNVPSTSNGELSPPTASGVVLSQRTINPRDYKTTKEIVYFWIAVLVSLLAYVGVFYAFYTKKPDAIDQAYYVIGIILGSFVVHFISIGNIRLNSLKIGPNQFPKIFEAQNRLAQRMGMKNPPDMYVMQMGGDLNAFAARLVSRKFLIMYTDLADALVEGNNQDQLDAVIAHELGHHALNHTHFYNWFIAPAEFLPFLGSALSRAREYSADKVMKALIGNNETCQRALIKLAAGKKLGKVANIDAYTNQVKTEHGLFVWIAQILASHPPLPKRILAIRDV